MLGSSCVMTTKVFPVSDLSLRIRSSSADEVIGSSPADGSSRKMTSGSSAIARAMAARLRMPPEISLGILPAASCISTSLRSAIARSRRSPAFSVVNSASGSITFSRQVIDPKSAPDWYMTPILRQRASRVSGPHSRPATVSFPPRIGFNPIRCRMIVVLPQPEPPRRMNTSPRRTVNETSFRMTTPGYPASTWLNSIMLSIRF